MTSTINKHKSPANTNTPSPKPKKQVKRSRKDSIPKPVRSTSTAPPSTSKAAATHEVFSEQDEEDDVASGDSEQYVEGEDGEEDENEDDEDEDEETPAPKKRKNFSEADDIALGEHVKIYEFLIPADGFFPRNLMHLDVASVRDTLNSNASDILKKSTGRASVNRTRTPTSSSADVQKVKVNDKVYVSKDQRSVGTIIKQEAVRLQPGYDQVSPSDIAMIDCGLNNILDMTTGTLSNQKRLFDAEDWQTIKERFSINNKKQDKAKHMKKLADVFKDPLDLKACYWKAKHLEEKSGKQQDRLGYELIAVIIDKMLKHKTIFDITKPTPSEADVMVKVWSQIFEDLFFETGLYIRWGEKSICSEDGSMFKLDIRFIIMVDDIECTVCCAEFAPYSGPKKVLTDRSKLLIEAKIAYNSIVNLGVSDEESSELAIVNLQVMGLEAHQLSISNVAEELYVARTIDTVMLPSGGRKLKKKARDIMDFLFNFKKASLTTADVIKAHLVEKKKIAKGMKRRLKEVEPEAESSRKSRITKSCRIKKTEKKNQ